MKRGKILPPMYCHICAITSECRERYFTLKTKSCSTPYPSTYNLCSNQAPSRVTTGNAAFIISNQTINEFVGQWRAGTAESAIGIHIVPCPDNGIVFRSRVSLSQGTRPTRTAEESQLGSAQNSAPRTKTKTRAERNGGTEEERSGGTEHSRNPNRNLKSI